MNVPHGLEDNPVAFAGIAASALASGGLLFAGGATWASSSSPAARHAASEGPPTPQTLNPAARHTASEGPPTP